MTDLKDQVFACIEVFLKEKYGDEIVTEKNLYDMDLLGSGIVGSLGYIELISMVEGKFDIEIDFDDVEPVEYSTISGLAKLVENSKANLN